MTPPIIAVEYLLAKNVIIAIMKPIFEIIPTVFNAAQTTLIGEISDEGFNYVFEENGEIIGIGASLFEKNYKDDDIAIALPIFFHQRKYFAETFKKIIIQFSFPQSAMVPFQLYKREDNAKVLDSLFGDSNYQTEIFTELPQGRNSYHIFRVCSSISEALRQQFPSAVFTHQFTSMACKKSENENELNIVFYGKKLVVSFFSGGKFRVFNSYYYQAPQDVSWILLNVTSVVDRNNVNLMVSGLIEESSILYTELKKYFNHIHFNNGPASIKYNAEMMQHPAHYLSHIFAIESCE